MSTLYLVEATLHRVRYYNADLNLDILWLHEQEILQNDLAGEVADLGGLRAPQYKLSTDRYHIQSTRVRPRYLLWMLR